GQHPAELAMRAGLRRQRDGRHAREFHEIVRERLHELDGALHRALRLEGMDVADAGKARHLLVEARVVLHRAGAERIQPAVDGVVLAREAYVMAHGLGLGEAGEADLRLALETTETRLRLGRRRKVDARAPYVADLEDQRLFMIETA